jgi:hypothetical protein
MMKITLEEIATELREMGIEAARDRLSLFKNEGLINLLQYTKLLHLVNGGDPEVMESWTFPNIQD